MEKKFLSIAEQQLYSLGIYHSKSSEKLKVLLWNIFIASLPFALLISAVSSLLLRQTSFSEFSEAFYMVMTGLLNICTYIVFATQKSKFLQLFENSREIIAKRIQNPLLSNIYMKMIEKTEKWTGIFYFAMSKQVIFTVIAAVIKSYFKYFFTESGPKSFTMPFAGAFPYDSTPLGYIFVTAFQFLALYKISMVCTLVLYIPAGISWTVMAFDDDIEVNINDLNKTISSDNKTSSNYLEVKRKLCDIFHIQGKAIQFSAELANAHKIISLAYFLWGIISICTGLIIVQMSIVNSSSFIDRVHPAVLIIASYGQIYLLCNFCNNMTTAQENIGNKISQSDWYLLPVNLQKLLPFSINVAQTPIYVKSFGSIACTREMFNKLVNKAFSYFMVLRQFEF